jgi:hypothetical protein
VLTGVANGAVRGDRAEGWLEQTRSLCGDRSGSQALEVKSRLWLTKKNLSG